MPTMRALVAHARGGPEQLAVEEVERPTAGPDEVLVEVHAAAITFAELTWDAPWTHLPMIPSHEFSGVVAEVGADVTDLAVGDGVYGLIPFDRSGAAAEYTAVPANALALRPRTVSHVVCAAVPLAALTALQALRDHAKVMPGDEVLVHGSAGGVGAFATQLAARMGAHVTATTLPADVGHARRLGAERVIDVAREAFDIVPHSFDVVIDTVGGDTTFRSFPVLRRGGRLVTLQGPPPSDRAAEFGVDAHFFVVTPDHADLVEIAASVDAGRIQVAIAQIFQLSEGRAAYESGATWDRPLGKTVLAVRDTSEVIEPRARPDA